MTANRQNNNNDDNGNKTKKNRRNQLENPRPSDEIKKLIDSIN